MIPLPTIKVRVGNQWVDVGLGLVEEAKSYIDQIKQELINEINDADSYLTGAFKDGVITVIEAKRIESYLENLELTKTQYDEQYDEIYSSNISETSKEVLETAKESFDQSYIDLITTINTVIADGKVSQDESDEVESKFIAFRSELSVLTTLLEKGVIEYVDATTQEVEQYIDGAFKDGIIYDSEYRKIQGYLNLLEQQKQETDQRFDQIYNNEYLKDTEEHTPKANLLTAKNNYDTAYNNLIAVIESAIADQLATTEESIEVDEKFEAFRTASAILAAMFEDATYHINVNDTSKQIDGIDFSPYATKSEVSQTANDLTVKFSSGGGVNLLKNSVGYSGTDFWTVLAGLGTVTTTQTPELDEKGAGSAFIIRDRTIRQTITVTPNQPYTVSTIVKKSSPGGGSFTISDGDSSIVKTLEDGVEYNYEKLVSTITPVGNQLIVELHGDDETDGVWFTSTMAHVGEVPLQWQHSAGEIYNRSIQMDLNGLRVLQIQDGRVISNTLMTPEKFAGYYDVDGDGVIDETNNSPDEVFRMDKDEFVMKKATVKEEITMDTVKIINVNEDTRKGWAFVAIE